MKYRFNAETRESHRRDAGSSRHPTQGHSARLGAATRAGHAACALLKALLSNYRGRAAIRLWDGQTLAANRHTTTFVVIRHPALVRRMVINADVLALAEAYLAGDIDVEGAIENAFDLVEFISLHRLSTGQRWRLAVQALRLPGSYRAGGVEAARAGKTMQHNERRTIGHHYDVSNDFYRLWLDPEMVYSCAYFSDPTQSLEAAQRDKLDYLCRKLRLQPGQTLLDVGCGWGALPSWAARNYGVRAHGITLSEQQYHYARERVAREGLQDRVKVELRDYRQLSETPGYDRIVSVGMFEHVGIANFPRYFGTVRRLLKAGGLFLNHGIAQESRWQATPITRFVNRYVFPDGELTRISDATAAMEDAGLEVLDVENLRPHYALTLRHWVSRLEKAAAQARALTSETTYRVWRLYMAGSAYYFSLGSLRVYQVLTGLANASPPAVPLRRGDLYEGC
ncbi:MAG: cyclopropane-fatty-acyl-phospholipid synthase family protein [Gammaproteobacteria bacterium]|jgi:cyclopropane-fatty-acyl-phospholipid synthase